MRKCNNYNIPCPYALSDESPMPCCVLSNENCEKWREKYKREVTGKLPPEKASKLEAELLKND